MAPSKSISLEEQVEKVIKDMKLSPEEVKAVLKNLRTLNPNRYEPQTINLSDSHFNFGVISDAHMGHMCYRPDILSHAVANFKRHGIDFIVNAGDTIEGMSGRDGHIFELTHIGATPQLDFTANEFSQLEHWTVYSIEASNSHGGWFKSKGNAGLDIGPELERRIKSYKFLGYDEQDLLLDNGIIIRLTHPGGGTAYSVSYKMQKYVESLSGGHKPNIVVQGHFHKAEYMFLRNVHCIDAGTLCDQTPWMKKQRTPAHTGYWIVDAYVNKKKKGIERIVTEFIPFYD